jgi:hypothetical protein
MRTRTLLLLAIGCGLVILLAGGIQLLRVSGDSPAGVDLAVGDTAKAGDMEVTVLSAAEQSSTMVIQVRVGGVDDPAGIDDFRLIVPGAALAPETVADTPSGSVDACGEVDVELQTCSLTFSTAEVQGSARVLLLRRGEDRRRWVLG